MYWVGEGMGWDGVSRPTAKGVCAVQGGLGWEGGVVGGHYCLSGVIPGV